MDVTHPIRENEVTNNVSWVSAIPQVREKLVALQQQIAAQGGIVMNGRDIGTVVHRARRADSRGGATGAIGAV